MECTNIDDVKSLASWHSVCLVLETLWKEKLAHPFLCELYKMLPPCYLLKAYFIDREALPARGNIDSWYPTCWSSRYREYQELNNSDSTNESKGIVAHKHLVISWIYSEIFPVFNRSFMFKVKNEEE